MGQRMKFPLAGAFGREWSIATAEMVIGASGAITSQTGARNAGFTLTKTATAGLYTATFDEKVGDVRLLNACIIGHTSNDPAVANTTGGSGETFLRNKNVAAGTMQVQFTRNDTSANADITNGLTAQVTFLVQGAGA
jgi:hypothetical protein